MCINLDSDNLFTLSELVLLNGEKFVKQIEYDSNLYCENIVNPKFPNNIFSDPLEKTLSRL